MHSAPTLGQGCVLGRHHRGAPGVVSWPCHSARQAVSRVVPCSPCNRAPPRCCASCRRAFRTCRRPTRPYCSAAARRVAACIATHPTPRPCAHAQLALTRGPAVSWPVSAVSWPCPRPYRGPVRSYHGSSPARLLRTVLPHQALCQDTLHCIVTQHRQMGSSPSNCLLSRFFLFTSFFFFI